MLRRPSRLSWNRREPPERRSSRERARNLALEHDERLASQATSPVGEVMRQLIGRVV